MSSNIKRLPGRPRRVDSDKKRPHHGLLKYVGETDDYIIAGSSSSNEAIKLDKDVNLCCCINAPIVIQKIVKALKNFNISSVMLYFTVDGIVITDVFQTENKPLFDIEIVIPASEMYMYYCASPYKIRFNYIALKDLVYGFSKDTLQMKISSYKHTYHDTLSFASTSNESKLEQVFEFGALVNRTAVLPDDIKINDVLKEYDYYKIGFSCHTAAFKQLYGKLCNIKKDMDTDDNIYLECYTNNAKCSTLLNSDGLTTAIANNINQKSKEKLSFEILYNNVKREDMLLSTTSVNLIKCIEPLGSINKKIYCHIIDDLNKYNKFTIYNDEDKYPMLPAKSICVNVYLPTSSSSISSQTYSNAFN